MAQLGALRWINKQTSGEIDSLSDDSFPLGAKYEMPMLCSPGSWMTRATAGVPDGGLAFRQATALALPAFIASRTVARAR